MNRTTLLSLASFAGSLALLTGCSQERPAPRTALAASDSPVAGMAHGTHDPKFGGVVMMNDKLHFEVVAKRDGSYLIYFSDEARRELPASAVTDLKIGVSRPGYRSEPVEMKVSDTGENWEGKGGSVNEADVTLLVSYAHQGQRRSSDLPFASAAGEKQVSAQHP